MTASRVLTHELVRIGTVVQVQTDTATYPGTVASIDNLGIALATPDRLAFYPWPAVLSVVVDGGAR